MDFQRLRVADWLTGAAGVAVLGSLWLGWFDVAATSFGALDRTVTTGAAFSAWEAFSVTDLILAAAALAGILMLVLAAGSDSPARPVAAGVLALALSGLGVLCVLYRVALDEPGPNDLVGLEPGAYVGMALAAGLFAAALAAVRDESSPHQPPIVPEQLPAPPAQA